MHAASVGVAVGDVVGVGMTAAAVADDTNYCFVTAVAVGIGDPHKPEGMVADMDIDWVSLCAEEVQISSCPFSNSFLHSTLAVDVVEADPGPEAVDWNYCVRCSLVVHGSYAVGSGFADCCSRAIACYVDRDCHNFGHFAHIDAYWWSEHFGVVVFAVDCSLIDHNAKVVFAHSLRSSTTIEHWQFLHSFDSQRVHY